MKITYDTDTGKAIIEREGEIIEDVACYDFKLNLSKSEARFYYWPRKKKDRIEAQRIYEETGERPPWRE